MEYNIKKLQDDDCNWYWIPKHIVEEFKSDNEKLSGVDYMDNPDGYDEFSKKYDKYRTGGSPDNVPDFFESKFYPLTKC